MMMWVMVQHGQVEKVTMGLDEYIEAYLYLVFRSSLGITGP